MRLEGRLEVHDVVDHAQYDLQLAEPPVSWHAGHQLLQFGEERLHLGAVQAARLAARAQLGCLGHAATRRLTLHDTSPGGHFLTRLSAEKNGRKGMPLETRASGGYGN